MATKITTGLIDSGAITSALITDASITADDLHTTLDLTGKTVTVATATAGDNDTSVASTAFVSTAIANLADSAPSTLDTLNELAAALGDDANFSTTVTNSIAAKLPLAGGTLTGNLLIGTTDAGYPAYGDELTIGSASGNNGMTIRSGTSNYGTFYFSDATGNGAGTYAGKLQYNHSNNSMVLATNSVDRLTITSSGDILGKTADVRIGSDVGSVEYGTSTANSVRFYSNDTEAMRITSSLNVGIGTTSPTGSGTVLHVNGSSTVADFHLTNTTSGTASTDGFVLRYSGLNAEFLNREAGSNIFYTSGTERMRIAAAGQVGIGGANYGTDGQVLTSTGAGSAPAWEDAAGGGGGLNPDGAVVFNESGADVDFRVESDGNANMLFVDGGNDFIGVGHGAPLHPLHVYDSTTTSTHPELAVGIKDSNIKGHAIMQFWSSDNGTIHFGDAASPWDGYISYSHNNQSMEFGVNGATRMSLMYTGQSVGALRIGTTSVLSGSNEKVSVTGDGGITVKTNYWAPYAPLTLWNNSSAGGTTYTYVYFLKPGGTVVGSVTSSGSTTSYNTSSDYRLKENVDYTWDATTRLKQLKPARFNWISDETNTLVDGFLAHEVSSIVPESITGVKDETETNENCILNAAGVQEVKGVTEAEWTAGKLPVLWTEDDELPDGVSVGDVHQEAAYASDTTWVASHTQDLNQSIDQSKLVPLLVKTIQELEARITVLEG